MPAPFQRLDHIAIIVRDTDEALKFYRDQLGLPFLFSQVMPDAPIRLTHLDAGGGVHLQLVQPLKDDHPLNAWLQKNGEGLQHLCFPNGRASAFLDPAATRGVQLEITSDPRA
jgi:methylmalonyl-CoA/ethylmalonyl-CoA epimerase